MDYWDTLGTKGERILGLIRSDDEVKIVEDADGLSWICVTCALWVQYSYKQVKRLLKDAKKALKEGKPAKNISVEIDILDSETLENGVKKINEFNLVGITILGSRAGVKVEPGIEDAQLSVVEIMGNTFYEKQRQAIRMAYEKLDESNQENNKEEFSDVENIEEVQQEPVIDEQNLNVENTEQAPVEEVVVEPAEPSEPVEEVQNPEENAEENNKGEDVQEPEEAPAPEGEQLPEESEPVEELGEELNSEELPQEENAPEQEPMQEPIPEAEQPQEPEQDPERQQNCMGCEESAEPCPICDVAWLIERTAMNIESYSYTIKFYEESEVPAKEYVVNTLKRFLNQEIERQKELAELLDKVNAEISEEEAQFAAKLVDNYDCTTLYKACEELQARCSAKDSECEALKTRLEKYEHEEFITEAKKIISSATSLSAEKAQSFEKDCEEGKINSLEELKVQVALAATFSTTEIKVETFNSPIDKPSTIIEAEDTKAKRKVNCWEGLRNYINK